MWALGGFRYLFSVERSRGAFGLDSCEYIGRTLVQARDLLQVAVSTRFQTNSGAVHLW